MPDEHNHTRLDAAQVGATFGRYAIEAKLGQGGQGTVFRARDLRLGRAVALKVLNLRGPLSERAALRLEREGMLAARIDHPSACEVYDCGIHAGQPFLAMRLVDGEPLGDLVRPTGPGTVRLDRADVERRLLWVEQIAEALHCAHQLGILHRDVKPGNILIARDGRAVLLDFGLAKETTETEMSLTAEGMLCGTPDYMSPEQLTFDAPPLDGRSDVYSLGATLYELIARQRPFRQDELFPTLASRRQLPDMRVVERAWNRDLRGVLDRVLAVDRAQRYDSARAFADDLRRCRQGLPVEARPTGTVLKVARWASRNRALAAASLAAVVSLIFGTAFSLMFAVDASAARDQSEWRRYGGSLALAAQLLGDGDRLGTLASLDDCEPTQRGYEWHLLRAQTDLALRRYQAGDSAVARLTALDGGGLAITSADGSTWRATPDAPTLEAMASAHTAKTLACDEAGGLRVLATERDRGSWLRFVSRGEPFDLPSPVRHPRLKVAPDGSGVCVCDYEATHCLAAAQGKSVGPTIERGTAPVSLFAVTRDGIRLVLPLNIDTEQRCVVEVRRWPDLALLTEFPITDGYCDAAALSADGQRLYLATSDPRAEHRSGAVQAWLLADGSRLGRYSGSLGKATSLEVSPDDEWVAVGEKTGTVRVLDGALSTEIRTLLGHTGEAVAMCAIDERLLAVGSSRGEVRVFGPRPTALNALAAWPVSGMWDMQLDPSGRTLWLASEFGVSRHDLRGETASITWNGVARVLGISADAVHLWSTSLNGGSPIREYDDTTRAARSLTAEQDEWVRGAVLDPDARVAFVVRGWAPPKLVQCRVGSEPLVEGASGMIETVLGELSQARSAPVLARSGDGRWLAVALGDEVSTWDIQSRRQIARRKLTDAARALAWDAEGGLVVGMARAWSRMPDRSLTHVVEVVMPGAVRTLAAHPTAPRVAVACSGGNVTICSVTPPQPIVTLPRFAGEVVRLAFDRAGERLAIGFRDSHAEVLNTLADAGVHPPPRVDPTAPSAAAGRPHLGAAHRIATRQRRYGYQTAVGALFLNLAERPNLPSFLYSTCCDLAALERSEDTSATHRALHCLALMRAGRDDEALAGGRALLERLAPTDEAGLTVQLRVALVEAVCGEPARAAATHAALIAAAHDDQSAVDRACPEAALVLGRGCGVAAARWVRDHADDDTATRAAALSAVTDHDLRATVGALLDLFPETAQPLRDAAWLVVSTPGFDPALYQQAAQWAQRADVLDPGEARPELHAGALVRIGQADAALPILDRLNNLDAQRSAVRLLFTALAHVQLGHLAQAQRAAAQFALTLGDARLSDHELRAALRGEVQRALAR